MTSSNGVKHRLLILDSVRSRKLFDTMLGDAYEVLYADSPEDALALIPLKNPDLVLLNYSLGATDGLTVAGKIREGGSPNVPILLLINGDRPTLKKQAAKAGCHGCVSKPIDPKKLLDQIEATLNSLNGADR